MLHDYPTGEKVKMTNQLFRLRSISLNYIYLKQMERIISAVSVINFKFSKSVHKWLNSRISYLALRDSHLFVNIAAATPTC